jgi:RES domain-containing protein
VGRKSGTLFQCPTCKLDILLDLMIPEIREEVNFESESLRAHSWQKCLKCSSLT